MKKAYFEVGMTVYHPAYGEGQVDHIYSTGVYPIRVKFSGNRLFSFTQCGRDNDENLYPTLSQRPWPSAVLEEIWTPKQGELVLVSDCSSSNVWYIGIYFGKTNDGRHQLAQFSDGTFFKVSSWTYVKPYPK